MEGRPRSKISLRRVEETGSSSQVLRGKFFKTDFTSFSDTAWKFDKNNPAKSGCWTFSFDTSKFSLIFVIFEVKKSKKYDGSWSGKGGVAFFPSSSLWRGKVLYRIPQRRICSDNNDVWSVDAVFCLLGVFHDVLYGD